MLEPNWLQINVMLFLSDHALGHFSAHALGHFSDHVLGQFSAHAFVGIFQPMTGKGTTSDGDPGKAMVCLAGIRALASKTSTKFQTSSNKFKQ